MKLRPWLLALLTLAAVPGARPAPAEACGAFFGRGAAKTPSLSIEQVLVVYDEAKHRQHFVREVAFEHGDASFGFVVPVPSKPEVEAVEDAPFARLAARFPFDEVEGGGSGAPRGAPRGGGATAGVTVHEVKQVGSFRAHVLSATDAGALEKWLADNEFVGRPAETTWAEGYVKRGFFFVAMRHDPPKAADEAKPGTKRAETKRAETKPTEGDPLADAPRTVRAETIRISFDTPAPYYPYLEPSHAAPTRTRGRLLSLWFASTRERWPVAALKRGDDVRWVQPWKQGPATGRVGTKALQDVLGKELGRLVGTEEKEWTVQVFEDQKSSREGFGDVLLVPSARAAGDRAALEGLASLLDPSLAGAP